VTVWGVYCRQEDERPVVVVVSAEDDGEPRLAEVLLFPASEHDDRPAQLHAIARAFATKVKDTHPAAIVVRSLDKMVGRQRKDTVTRLHYQVEGVLLEVSRRQGETVVAALNGKEIGQTLGRRKADVEADAAAALGNALKEAGAAALAARVLAATT
jgi:hypothetical protein